MTPDAEHFHEQPEIIEERLSAYLDDMLDAEERTRLEAHIARCERCQQQLAELRRVRALMHALPQPALPRSFLLPVVVAPAPATSASPASPVRLRSTLRRQQAARMARAAQWLGTIAALLGLALLVSTAVLGTRGGTEATSSAAPAAGGATSGQSPTFNSQQGSPQARVPTPVATAPDVATGHDTAKSPGTAQDNAGPSQARPSLLDLQLGGGALLVAGVVLVVVSSVARRRSGSNQLAPPTTGN